MDLNLSKVEGGRRLKSYHFSLVSKSCKSYSIQNQCICYTSSVITFVEAHGYLCFVSQSGRGKWKEIATLIPSRSTVQVKTHAQMVMKRVEAGEDVFEDLRELKAEQKTVVIQNCSPSRPTQSSMICHRVVMDSLQAYDTLTQRDQGAVMILFQMGKAM